MFGVEQSCGLLLYNFSGCRLGAKGHTDFDFSLFFNEAFCTQTRKLPPLTSDRPRLKSHKIKIQKKKQVNLLSDDTSVIDLGSPYVGLKFPNILRPTKPVASRLTEAERLPQLPFFNFSRLRRGRGPFRPKA